MEPVTHEWRTEETGRELEWKGGNRFPWWRLRQLPWAWIVIVLSCVVAARIFMLDQFGSVSRAVRLQKSTAPHGEARMVKTVDGVEYAFRWCPPGSFLMGAPLWEMDGYEVIRHRVRLTKGFWMLETEVTEKMWKSVMECEPQYSNGDEFPVDWVSWYEGQEFCEKLSSKIGMKISLPTEAQWEYACRAGTVRRFAGKLDEVGWYKDNSRGDLHPVGQKKPNAWGLYDMHGNVQEWCLDWYGGTYPFYLVTDPTGPAEGSKRIQRGGNWEDVAEVCKSSYRHWSLPELSRKSGFRVIVIEEQGE